MLNLEHVTWTYEYLGQSVGSSYDVEPAENQKYPK